MQVTSVQEMVADMQPRALVLANQRSVDDKRLDQIEKRIPLEITTGVIGEIADRVAKLVTRDVEGPKNVACHVRRERLGACAFDDAPQQH